MSGSGGEKIKEAYKELKERNHTEDTEGVCNERHDSTEFGERRVEERTKEQGEQELDKENGGVPDDGSERDHGNTDQWAWWLVSIIIGERLDEHVGNDEKDSHDGREYDLRENDGSPSGTRDVSRELLRRVSEPLLLVTSDHGTRQPTVANPRIRVRPRISSVHPPQELSKDKIGSVRNSTNREGCHTCSQ